jgi:outer membrane protein TolC
MNKKIAIILFAALGLLQESYAQPGARSLKECIEYGLKNFGTVRIAEYQKQTADQQARQAVGQYLPQVSGSGTFTNNIKLQRSIIPAGVFGPEPQVLIIGQKFQNNLVAQATQPIYDQSLLIGLKANKPNQRLAALNERQIREEIVYNISSNYYQVYVAQQQIDLLQDNLKRTQQVLDVLKLQRDNGVIQPIDYTNTEVSFNNTKSQLTLAQNDLELALNRLKYQMGLSQDAALAVADSIKGGVLPVFGSDPFDAQKLVSFQQASSNLELQRLQVQRIRAGYLPTLGLTATYGTLNFAQTFDRAFSNFVGFGSFGLRLNLPVFDGFQRDAQIQQQKLTVLTQEAQQRLNVEAYRLQFNNSLSQIQKAQINAQNDSRNVQLAQEVYNITTLQYKQGTKSITDVINADNSYRQSQFNYINSLISFYQARLDLEQSQGTLLSFYNEL